MSQTIFEACAEAAYSERAITAAKNAGRHFHLRDVSMQNARTAQQAMRSIFVHCARMHNQAGVSFVRAARTWAAMQGEA